MATTLLRDLSPHDSLVRLSSYREYDPDVDLGYGELYPFEQPKLLADDVLFVLAHLLAGSDYSGGSVTVSNHRLFLEEFGELEGVHDVNGGYGSYGVAIRLDVWQAGSDQSECTWYGSDPETASCGVEEKPCPHQIREWLASIEDYPVYDEDDLGQVEMEAENEAWDSWAESDFARVIQGRFADDIDVTDSDQFREWFEELRERANVYWENETGNSAHVDLERVAAELTDVGQVVEAANDHGFELELIRRVSYLPYCQTCGLLISDGDSSTEDKALAESGSPSHLEHTRIALQRVVYLEPEG